MERNPHAGTSVADGLSPTGPEWVRAVNAGLAGPLAEAGRPLTASGLLDEARATTGLDDFGSGDFEEPLRLLTADLAEHAALTPLGHWQTRRYLLRLLRVRLQVADWVRRDPGVLDEVVEQPLFVAGAPRTGTSLLHALLACDPRLRAPEGWELLLPVPPPPGDAAEFAADPRIPVADAELRFFDEAGGAGKLDAIHVYGARLPKECLSAQAFSFRSQEFSARYHVPTYERWLLDEADMRPAYDFHRLVLAILQRRARVRRRWVLKSPVHLHSLDALFATYPDARVVVTHRDPMTLLGSVSSLIATLRSVHSDLPEASDLRLLGRYHADLYASDLDGLVDHDLAGDLTGRSAHVAYRELAADPTAAVEDLYAALGDELTDEARAAMAAYAASRPKDKHGTHRYDFADLGLDRAEQEARFARYRTHFHV